MNSRASTKASDEKALASIASLFETGKVKKMYDIAELYPTKIIKLLGINSERYSVKLSRPEKFTVSELLRLAHILGITPNLILEVIKVEADTRIVGEISRQKEKRSRTLSKS